MTDEQIVCFIEGWINPDLVEPPGRRPKSASVTIASKRLKNGSRVFRFGTSNWFPSLSEAIEQVAVPKIQLTLPVDPVAP